jgi:hypothetical protein
METPGVFIDKNTKKMVNKQGSQKAKVDRKKTRDCRIENICF